MATSCYIGILIKSQKGLELLAILQYLAKNMLEMFAMHQTIWSNFILIVLRIQKK